MTDDKAALLDDVERVVLAQRAVFMQYGDGQQMHAQLEREMAQAAIAALSPRTEGWVMVPRSLLLLAHSALDGLMGDSDLPEDDSLEMQACQALMAALGNTAADCDAPAEQP